MEIKFTFEDGSEALMHYGVKGMKWKDHTYAQPKRGSYEQRRKMYAKKGLELRSDGSLWKMDTKKRGDKLSEYEKKRKAYAEKGLELRKDGSLWKNAKGQGGKVEEGSEYDIRRKYYAKQGLELRKDGSLWELPKKKDSTSKTNKLESIASKKTAAANGATAKSLKAKVKSRFRSKNVSDETLLRRRRAFENRYTEVDEKGNTRIRKYQ